jgi:hypothetical protein
MRITDLTCNITRTLDQLERNSIRIDGIVISPTPDSLREFAHLRREIADLFYEVSQLIETAEGRLPPETKATNSMMLRQRLSGLRTALANLQADWPLPHILNDVEGYRTAKRSFNDVQNQFLTYIRHEILPVLGPGSDS